MTHHVLIATEHAYPEASLKALRAIGTVRVIAADRLVPGIVGLKTATVLIAGLSRPIDIALFSAAPALRLVATPATGTDHIDLDAARTRGIRVLSLQDETAFLRGITGTAELAWGLMLSLVRRIPSAAMAVKKTKWDRSAFLGASLSGKTLGVVGVGRLGSMVARYGKTFGMRVIGADVRRIAGIPLVPLRKLLAESDIVSLHVPLNALTAGMIGSAEVRLMKQGAFLINTARGEVVDEHAVLSAIKSGRLAGYATDVLAGEASMTERDRKRHPLLAHAKTHDNVLVTPHIGGMTKESREATDAFMTEKVLSALRSLR